MKKLCALFLAVMLIAALTIPVFAEETVDANGGGANINVNGVVQYTGSSETQTISVDVAWENMTFTYVEGVHFGWDPENHEYAGAYEGYWENDRADITFTNHSNTEVHTTLSFESGVDTVSGAFTEGSGTMDDGVLELASAVDTEVEEAPTATATFNISGSISASADVIGEITVLIESAYHVPEPKITAFGFEETSYLGVNIDRLGRITYTATIPRNMPDSLKIQLPVILVGENLNYATGDDCQIALLTSSGLAVTSCVVNTESLTYDFEKGCWTTKNLELPKNAGTYKLAYSNDGGETWTQIGHVLTIEISAI